MYFFKYIYMCWKNQINKIFKYKHQIFYFNVWTETLDWNVPLLDLSKLLQLALAVYFTTHSSSGRASYFELSTAQTLCACWLWKLFSYSDASGKWTSCWHPSARPGPARPSLQYILSQLTSPGLMKSLKRTTPISSQCKRISKST